jgi:F-box interacting protein
MAPRTTSTKRRRLNSTENPLLPFDLVVEILSRLPVKSLMQFQSVCKPWKSVISDSKFAKKHLRVTCRHIFFRRFFKDEYTFNDCTLSSVFTRRKLTPTAATTRQLEYPMINRIRIYDQIRGSCHGILCIQLYGSFIILWNPSIRKFTRLPYLKIPGNFTTYSSFGYDHSTDSYKVVACSCIKRDNGVYEVKTFVHTMGTDFWRRIQDFPCVLLTQSGKFVSGTLNWLPYNHSSIVSLDLEKEYYRDLPLPDYVSVLSKSLWVLRDCLCILSFHTDAYSEIWLMKEFGNKNSWTKLFRVPRMGDVGSGIYDRALYIYEDDQVLLDHRSKLVVHNSSDGTFKTLQIKKRHGWMIPEVYQESLISPCS